MSKAAYFKSAEGMPLPRFRTSVRVNGFLWDFIENGRKDMAT